MFDLFTLPGDITEDDGISFKILSLNQFYESIDQERVAYEVIPDQPLNMFLSIVSPLFGEHITINYALSPFHASWLLRQWLDSKSQDFQNQFADNTRWWRNTLRESLYSLDCHINRFRSNSLSTSFYHKFFPISDVLSTPLNLKLDEYVSIKILAKAADLGMDREFYLAMGQTRQSFYRSSILALFWPGNIAIIAPPVNVEFDANAREHNANGPAVVWRDGIEEYYWRGMSVRKGIIINPIPTDIVTEQNVELRRAIIEKIGVEKVLHDLRAERIDSSEWRNRKGTLWRVNLSKLRTFGLQNTTNSIFDPNVRDSFANLNWIGGRAIAQPQIMQWVQVENWTQSPDGTFRNFFLRVPPNIQTAREAIAWTYHSTAEGFDPNITT